MESSESVGGVAEPRAAAAQVPPAGESALRRARLAKLFEFLRAYTELRFPPVRDVADQPRALWLKDLPAHGSVELFRDLARGAEETEETEMVLRLTRPSTTECPAPPAGLAEWLNPAWRDFPGAAQAEETRNVPGRNGKATIERFDGKAERVSQLRAWEVEREEWVRGERPAREALALFQTVYEWFGVQQREGERMELLVGDGLLQCVSENGERFCHPVLLQKLELEFYPEKRQPQFILRKREQQPPELYMEFLRVLPGVNAQQLAACAEELKKAEFAPLGGEETDGFLRRLIQGLFPSSGKMREGQRGESGTPSVPTIERRPVIFMRQRRTGSANVFDLVLEDIGQREDFPSALLQILGLDGCGVLPAEPGAGGTAFGNEDAEVLLSKPANREQLEIAKQLSRRNCVLVQGPPGTGKTHTIANLLGHLLSQGKRVLVTAHTPKALRVLRQKIVEPLQPLCISVLQNDKQSQEELQSAVQKINVRLSEEERLLERDARRLSEERKRMLAALGSARARLLEARQDENRDVVVGESSMRPIAAAKRVKEGVGRDDWIPTPVSLGASLPLSMADVAAVYQSNARVSLGDERELAAERADLSKMPTAKEFEGAVGELRELREQDLGVREELWDDSREPGELTEFDRMLELASKAIEFLREGAPWQLEAVQASRDGEQARQVWESLAELIERTWGEVQECHAIVMEHGPEITDPRPTHELLQMVEEMIAHQQAGNSFGLLTKLAKRHWFELKERVQVGQRAFELGNAAHLHAVRALLRMRQLRDDLLGRWERQMASRGGLACADLGERPEQVCKQFVPQIQLCLQWHSSTWQPLENEFQRLGFRWPAFLDSTAPEAGDNAALRRIRTAVVGDLGPILQSRSRWLRNKRLRAMLEGWHQQAAVGSGPQSQAMGWLREAIRNESATDYEAAYQELARLKGLEADLARRRELLQRMGETAPAWKSAIENRVERHSGSEPPGDPQAAWEWRQIHEELERRASVSINELQQEIEKLAQELLETTAQLVEKQTWLNQIRQTTSAQKQALGAYAAMRNKLTKTGKGVRDAELRAAARREMASAKDAVPVWIMPLAEVAESFDPRKTRFDVVIIDEASQCDATSLFALYLGRQAVIVGDDEQVTPVAVGVAAEEVSRMIEIFLQGVPYKELYDGETSVYELAQIAFGGVIRLTEHFRCAPSIISFSNNLSYKGEIKPLREAASIPLAPHVLQCRVEGRQQGEENINEAEAEYVVSLICAAIEQPEYATNHEGEAATFGVVSLVGDKQAMHIDSILRRRIEPLEYRRRQILCGDSAQFQGDERDVMFLSVVDSSPRQPPLTMRQEGPKKIFKKRFNVAASRARNQMWVVHSLNPETDLQMGDYRRRLIEHALDPEAAERELRKRLARAQSRSREFQGMVLRRLVEREYKVTPDFAAGACTIDLVVSGNGRRLAIECDGEQFDGPEKLQEELERQAILERLGWTFVRVRGSLFFRDQDRALQPVLRRLQEMDINPGISMSSSVAAAPADSGVVERVMRRAEELRLVWHGGAVDYKPT